METLLYIFLGLCALYTILKLSEYIVEKYFENHIPYIKIEFHCLECNAELDENYIYSLNACPTCGNVGNESLPHEVVIKQRFKSTDKWKIKETYQRGQ